MPATAQRRPSKHDLDPRDKYIRRVKGGKFQCRPYCVIARERYDLGLFATIQEARAAVQEFWRGKRSDVPRYTKRFHIGGEERFMAVVGLGRGILTGDPTARGSVETITTGPFVTREEAVAAAQGILVAAVGPLYTPAYLAMRGTRVKPPRAKPREAPGQPQRALWETDAT